MKSQPKYQVHVLELDLLDSSIIDGVADLSCAEMLSMGKDRFLATRTPELAAEQLSFVKRSLLNRERYEQMAMLTKIGLHGPAMQ